MNLKELLHQISDAGISEGERARLRCVLAKQYEQAGDYESARRAMADLWQRVGEFPEVGDLGSAAKAEVLLRAGALTGWIGSARQIEGAQELAKDLISDSIRIFEELSVKSKVAEAHSDLAVCYWREGAFDEARVLLNQALNDFDESSLEEKAIALIRKALVERASKRLHDALRVYGDASSLFLRISNPVLLGQFHYGLGNVLNQLRTTESHDDYIDRALVEYSAAAFHFEKAGLARYQACLENNLAYLYCALRKFPEAHNHLDQAQTLLTRLKDNVHLAQVDETRARVMLAEGRVVEAEKTARAAVRRLEQGDEQSLLAEALTTHGIAQARLKHPVQAKLTLERAVETSERAGDLESAGNAALVMVEELNAFLSNDDLKATLDRARELLANTQDLAALKRVCACASQVISLMQDRPGLPRTVEWRNFSFRQAVLLYEAHFIKLALDASNGVVTQAARLLGFNHHQSLLSLLNARHKELRDRTPTPIVPRRRSIIKTPRQRKGKTDETSNGSSGTKGKA